MTDISTVQLAIFPKILLMTSIVRLLLIILMAVSDVAISDHNPGDDVLRFDLRLSSGCFCRQGLACDADWESHERSTLTSPCVESTARDYSAAWNTLLQSMSKWDAARFLTLAADPRQREPNLLEPEDQFMDSEQAHAFFPLFPLLIRHAALILMRTIPRALLPPTFESVLVLSGALLNAISFLMAAFFLASLTVSLILQNDGKPDEALQLAGTVATLFCLNPATIFFGTCYSESLFAMLTFGGYALYTQGYCYLATIPWMAASYTRSNGAMVSAWLLIQGVSEMLRKNQLPKQLLGLASHIVLAVAVAIPIFVHDRTGYALHCKEGDVRPMWCDDDTSFSLYSHVQREHWNVGFLRYYEWKQLPNFLLAAPVLVSSFLGAKTWIETSWKEQPTDRMGWFPVKVVRWSLWALPHSREAVRASSNKAMYAPQMLGHYAVLAAAALLGLTVAHVQISTRLLCSTCPAIYWQWAQFEPKRLLVVYIAVYTIIGTILHVNFLPWT